MRPAPPLQSPYPPADLRETHTGLVVLFGDRAYKVKKPITTDFLDFGTPQDRERACLRELALNRRLAPDVYLGLAHLTDPDGSRAEPVLVMRRMPEQYRLSTLVTEARSSEKSMRALAATLVAFHDGAHRGPEIDRAGTADALRHRWRDVLGTVSKRPAGPLALDRLVEIEDRAVRYLNGRTRLFEDRIERGLIVDGHGDLLAEDIFELPDGFRILDCLDFDDRLRWVDRIDDIAFLAMDLEFLDRPELGAELLAAYRHISGDDAPSTLTHHYRAYRAVVRAKVDTIRYEQGDLAARERGDRHLILAAEHLRQGAVRVGMVGGLPGTGKSTVAHRLAAATGAVALSSDSVRRELTARGEISGSAGLYNAGTYAPDARHRVYAELLRRAEPLLGTGISVVLDAGWPQDTERQRARDLAAAAEAELVELCCECPRPVADRRLLSRGRTESDATPRIAEAISETAAPWPEADVLDTRPEPERVVIAAAARWYDSRPREPSQAVPGR